MNTPILTDLFKTLFSFKLYCGEWN